MYWRSCLGTGLLRCSRPPATVWGGSYVAIEVGLTEFPPVFLTALQYYLAAAVLLTVVVLGDDDPWPRTRADGLGILAGGYLLARVGSFQSNLVSRVSPPVAAVAGFALLEERPSPLAVVGFGGILLVDSRTVRAELARAAAVDVGRNPGR
jgi:drug/metabolite transporter (DMT)-like permease